MNKIRYQYFTIAQSTLPLLLSLPSSHSVAPLALHLGLLVTFLQNIPLNVTNNFPSPFHSYDIQYSYNHIAQSSLNTCRLISMSACLSLLYFLFVFSIFPHIYL